MTNVLLAIIFATTTCLLLWKLTGSIKFVLIHLFLLAVTPWFLTLVLADPSLSQASQLKPFIDRITDNLSFLTSDDFLFFTGDGRPGYGTGNHGVFLLSLLPLMLSGIYFVATTTDKRFKIIFAWILTGLAISVITSGIAGLHAGLWYLPAFSTLATLGAKEAINCFSTKLPKPILVRVLWSINFAWLIYESLGLYHAIFIHKPFLL